MEVQICPRTRRLGKVSNRRLVPADTPQLGGLGLFFDGGLCLTWGGYPDTLASCRAPCQWNILARSIT